MRVLLVSSDVPSGLLDLVSLGWALRVSGHEVCAMTPPSLSGVVARSGLPGAPAVDGPGGWADFGRAWRPDLVVWDHSTVSGPDVGTTEGLVGVRMLGWPDPGRRPAAAPWAESTRAGVAAAVTLDLVPPWLRPADDEEARWPLRPIPYEGPAVLPARLSRPARRRPRLCLSLGGDGSALPRRGVPAEVVTALMDAAVAAGLEVVADVDLAALPASFVLPDGVRLLESVPLHAVLPTCTALVHDGNWTAIRAALVTGRPQLVLLPETPTPADEMLPRLGGRGVAVTTRVAEVDEAHAATLLDQLLQPALVTAAAVVAEELAAAPTPADIVPRLVDIAVLRNSGL